MMIPFRGDRGAARFGVVAAREATRHYQALPLDVRRGITSALIGHTLFLWALHSATSGTSLNPTGDLKTGLLLLLIGWIGTGLCLIRHTDPRRPRSTNDA